MQADYSDVPDELWDQVKQWIPPWRRSPRGGPRRLDNRKAFAGIVYRLRTGCQWDARLRGYWLPVERQRSRYCSVGERIVALGNAIPKLAVWRVSKARQYHGTSAWVHQDCSTLPHYQNFHQGRVLESANELLFGRALSRTP